jgi:hypothetical protein
MSENATYASPRIKQLVQEVEAGKVDAEVAFWEEVKAAGVPFIEPTEITCKKDNDEEETVIDEEHVWVTFLYEGDENTENVTLSTYFMFQRMSAELDPKKLIIN